MQPKLKLTLLLFLLGFLGVLSLLTVQFPADAIPAAVAEKFSPTELKLLTLINPTLLLLIAIAIGVTLFDKVNLHLPLLYRNPDGLSTGEILRSGIVGGLLAGILLSGIGLLFKLLLPQEFEAIGSNVELSVLARLLYGGITEELLLRFGFMTLVVWLGFKLSKSLSPAVYWTGIIISSIVFALGHFPVVFQSLESPSIAFLSYILIGNSVGGLIFGWLYWKKGLEAAFVAHMAAHVVMLIGEMLVAM